MGKELSHILCAEQAAYSGAGASGGGLRSLLGDFSRCYHLGSIVPDTFFYAVRLPFTTGNPSGYGDMIHGSGGNDTGRPAHEMLKALRDAPHDPLFMEKAAFVCGYLTHIALDSVLHPYVYHVSGNYYADCPVERREAQARHRLIEGWFDLHLLQLASRKLAGCAYLSDIRRNGSVTRELLRFFLDACEKSMPMDPAAWRDLLRGYRVQMTLNAVFRMASAEKLVRRMDRTLGGRLMSFHALFYPGKFREIPREIIHFPSFRHPVTGEEREGGFESLWKQALARSEEFLAAAATFLFAGGGDDGLRSVIKGYSLSSGIVGVPIRDAVYYDCIPLEKLRFPE
jgi:hypothetical protein